MDEYIWTTKISNINHNRTTKNWFILFNKSWFMESWKVLSLSMSSKMWPPYCWPDGSKMWERDGERWDESWFAGNERITLPFTLFIPLSLTFFPREEYYTMRMTYKKQKKISGNITYQQQFHLVSTLTFFLQKTFSHLVSLSLSLSHSFTLLLTLFLLMRA